MAPPTSGNPPLAGGIQLQRRHRRWLVTGLVATNLAWAASYPAAAVALRAIPAPLLTLLRVAAAALVLLPWLRLPAGRRWDGRSAAAAIALGTLGFSWPLYLQTLGIRLADPATTAILVALEPLCTALFAGVALHQTIPPRRRAALGIALGGAWLIAGLPRPGHAGHLVGELVLLASTLCFSSYNVLSAHLSRRVTPTAAAAGTMWGGLIGMIPLWLLLGPRRLSRPGPAPALAAGYLGVVATGLAYVVWVPALSGLPAAEAALYLYLQPVAGALLSVWFTGVRPTAAFYAGAALILAAVVLGAERAGPPPA